MKSKNKATSTVFYIVRSCPVSKNLERYNSVYHGDSGVTVYK